MFILELLPDWLLYSIILINFTALILCSIIVIIPYRQAIQIIALIILMLATWLSGVKSNEESWNNKVKQLQIKVLEAENKSKEVNTVIVEKIIKKKELIYTKGQDIVKFIDKEVIKYDDQCRIPEVAIKAHNLAAESIK